MWPTARAEDAESSGMRHSRGVADTLTAVTRQWMTPNVPNGGRSAAHAEMIGRTAMHNGKKVQIGLEHQVSQWPTPAARDHKGANSSEHVTTNGTGRRHLDQLPNFVEHCFSPPAPPTPAGPPSSPPRRVLNPLFVEWLMGWPIGWTDSEPAATELSLWLQLMRGELSTLCLRTAGQPGQLGLF
jgi:hypothetical protein